MMQAFLHSPRNSQSPALLRRVLGHRRGAPEEAKLRWYMDMVHIFKMLSVAFAILEFQVRIILDSGG